MPNILSAVKSCCRYNGTARACYTACCWLASEETCAKRCDCILIPRNSGVDRCPEGYRSLTIIPDFEGLESIEYCRLGCRSFVCSNMNSVEHPKLLYFFVFRRNQSTMGSKGININGVLMCVLVLGLALELVHVEAKSCCRNGMARNCFNACRFVASQQTCANSCDCKLISGISRDQCPEGYRSLTFIPDFERLESISEYCRLGCRSFVCGNMNSVDDTKEKATIVERCSEGCDRFCSRDASIASVAA
uniref:Uncharacterized protein n=1 Tax=Leersia perrieri TaxID=77586 RepID=A0A0D9XQB1_9ORYZ